MWSNKKYWYFSGLDKKLRYGDDRAIELGKTHWVLKRPIVCKQGLHACKDLHSAFHCSPGPILWQVELKGVRKTENTVIDVFTYDGNETYVPYNKTSAMGRKYVAGGINILDTMLDLIYSYIPDDKRGFVIEYNGKGIPNDGLIQKYFGYRANYNKQIFIKTYKDIIEMRDIHHEMAVMTHVCNALESIRYHVDPQVFEKIEKLVTLELAK